MSLESRITELAQAIGADIKTINSALSSVPEFDAQAASERDLLMFINGKWKSTPPEVVTDGGNF